MSNSTFQNVMSAILLAPLLVISSAIPLALVQRGLEWVTFIAKTPQKGYLKEARPYVQQLDKILERILGGNKFTVTATNILLMALVVLLLTLILTKSQETVVKIQSKKEQKEE